MPIDDYTIQISGAMLDQRVSAEIKNQLKAIKGLSVTVERIDLPPSSFSNVKKMLTTKQINLQVELDSSALKRQAREIGRNIGKQICDGVHDVVQKENALADIKNVGSPKIAWAL